MDRIEWRVTVDGGAGETKDEKVQKGRFGGGKIAGVMQVALKWNDHA